MPAIQHRKVIVEVEFTVDGVGSYGEAADYAAKPIEAIPGATIKSVRVEQR